MKPVVRKVLSVLRIALGIGLLWYLATSGMLDWSRLLGLAHAWPLTLAAATLFLIDLVITASRLCVLMRALDLRLALSGAVQLSLIGLFFGTVLPGAASGEVFRIYYAASGNEGRRMEVGTVMLLDRALGVFALLLWPLLVIPFIPRSLLDNDVIRGLLLGAAIFVGVLLVGMLVVLSARLRHSRLVTWTLAHIPLGAYLTRVVDTVHAYRTRPSALLAAVGISLVAHTMSIGIALLIAEAILPTGAAAEMTVLIPFGHVANTIPLTPGGLGVGEAAFDRLFGLAGLSGGAEVLLGWRLITILVSLGGLAIYLRGARRLVHQAA
ncbi:MAG TPA: lysylphosphatidylglycerol synthase transmembrane domain-containing protein [Gemmatimonadaceae bacterium]|nr:lysylphosphatidylglycerol synthase transmembrane domain-containing protein [Gemmatimonadaceae bacterium]